MIIDFNYFRKLVFRWANEYRDRFQYFWPLDGGWEHWVQAEVAAYILKENSTYEILREQNIYNNNQTADWALNQATGGNERIAVELKCQRGTDPNGGTFIGDIINDTNKLANNLDISVQVALVGIYYNQNAKDELKNRTYNFTKYNSETYDNEIGVFVFSSVDFPE